MSDITNRPGRLVFKTVTAGLVGLFGIIGACSSIYIVDTSNVGVIRHFREVTGDTVQPGVHFVNPVSTDIVEMSTQVARWDGKTEAYTKDVQQATIEFTLTYKLDAAHAPEMYSDYRDQWAERLVGQVVAEEIKRELGQHNAVDLIARRAAASTTMTANITNRLQLQHVIVTGFALRDIAYDSNFEKSVEQKVIAQQKSIEEQNRTVQVEEQAKQKVATAKGQAEATLLQAEAEAKAIRIKTEALEGNSKLIELTKAERWNGQLPTTVLGSGTVPFFNVQEK